MSLFCFCQCVQVWVHIFWPFNLHFHLQQIFSYFSIYFHSLGLSSFSVHCKRYFDAFFLKFTFRGVGFFTFTFRGLAFSLSLLEGWLFHFHFQRGWLHAGGACDVTQVSSLLSLAGDDYVSCKKYEQCQ